jgi:phosphoribosylformylglycinamidine synthase
MPSALIITAAGTNCDRELALAFSLAGAEPESIHLHELLDQPALMDRFDLIGLPGGFSYGDAVAAGRIAAQLMRQSLYPAFVRAIDRGVPIIAPCNGFQIAVQMGLLPGPEPGEPWPNEPPAPSLALADNDSARFTDRWVKVEIDPDCPCVWTAGLAAGGTGTMLPIAHGEGCFIASSSSQLDQLERASRVAIRYAAGDNPNGSERRIAGLCDASGLVLGLMPHPERFTRWTQHPFWTRLGEGGTATEPLGLRMFRSAVAHACRETQPA